MEADGWTDVSGRGIFRIINSFLANYGEKKSYVASIKDVTERRNTA